MASNDNDDFVPESAAFGGIKSMHHHRGTKPSLRLSPDPKLTEQKGYGIYNFFGKTRKQGISP